MPTNNAVNITAAGIVRYDGAGTFNAVTLTQHSPLIGASSNGISSLGPLTNGQLVVGSTGVAPVATTLTAGTGVSISNGAGSITISSTGTGLTWSDQSGVFTAASNNGYFLTGAATPTLPAAPSNGDVIAFVVQASASMTITANTGQIINLGNTASAAAGTCATSVAGNSIFLVYRSTGTTWWAISSIGSWNIT